MGQREQRLVFGEVAERYHRRRPGYPTAVVELVVASTGTGGRVLEVGAGTGKLTEALLRRGLRVDALEPSPEMAAVLRRTVAGAPATAVLEHGLEDLPPGAGPYDVLVAGQSWHWLRPGERLDVAHRAVRAGGRLVLAWNREEHPGAVGDAIVAAYRTEAPELVDAGELTWLDALVDELADDHRFDEVERSEVPWPLVRTRDEYLEVLTTYSPHRLLDADVRARLHGAIGDAIDRHGGAISLDGRTTVVTARRT